LAALPVTIPVTRGSFVTASSFDSPVIADQAEVFDHGREQLSAFELLQQKQPPASALLSASITPSDAVTVIAATT